MKLECSHVDTCLACYWSGHHLPHVQIPVWRRMTLAEVKRELTGELRQGAVMGSTDDARLLSADFVAPDEEKRADRLTRAAYAAVRRIKPAKKGARKLFLDLEKGEDDDETVYAFFVFVEA